MDDEICVVLHTEDGRVIGVQYPTTIKSIDKFVALLHHLEGKARYLERHNLLLVLPICFEIASVLSHETNISKLLDTYPFIRLMISEDFPNLIDGRKNRLLDQLSTQYKLWLSNLGSGRTNLTAVMEGCFDGLVLDAGFASGNKDKDIFPVVLKEMNKYCHHLIVPGISTGRYRHVRLMHIEQLI